LHGWRNGRTRNLGKASTLWRGRRRWRRESRRRKCRWRNGRTVNRRKRSALWRRRRRWRGESRRRKCRCRRHNGKIPLYRCIVPGRRFGYRRRRKARRHRNKRGGFWCGRRSRSKGLRDGSEPSWFLCRLKVRGRWHVCRCLRGNHCRWWRQAHRHSRSTSATKDRRAIQRRTTLAAKLSHCSFHLSLYGYAAR
jgi:hypothetical protein